jgi:hypothetical protein
MNDLDTANRYPALSAIVVVIKIVAVLVALIGGLVAFRTMQFGVDVAGIGIIVGVVVGFVIMWAAAESIAVIIDIEANTRASAIAATRKAYQEPVLERISTDPHDRLPPLGTR